MKPGGKKKPKKKKMPEPGAGATGPRFGGFSSSSSVPIQENARRAEVYRTLAENNDPSAADVRQAEWCRAHGRTARSQSFLSHQMGELGIAGHLPRNRAVPIPRFDSPIHQRLGPPAAAWRSTTYGFPPESGVRRYKCGSERNWWRADERAIQVQYMQEAQAQHYSLARAGHDLKCQCLELEWEGRFLQLQERRRQMEMEGSMIHMYHCPLHMLLDQAPEHCICCENNQANITRLKLAALRNDKFMRQNIVKEKEVRDHMRTIDEATWGARLEAERAEGQLNFRVTRAGDYKESHCDDSPYSTDRFDDEEEKQDSDLPALVARPVLPAENDNPPEYEAPEAEFENPRFK